MRNRARGIALVDLLVLVALISILAAIFIPRFAAFAVRSYNAAAISDLRGAISAEESLFADYGGYGRSQFVSVLPGAGGTGFGYELFGPMSPATATNAGGSLTMGPTIDGNPSVGIGIPVSADVTLRAETLDSSGSRTGYGASYLLAAKHRMGDTVFAAEAEKKKEIYICRNTYFTWVGVSGLSMVMLPATTMWMDLSFVPYGVPCGGVEIQVWTPLP